MTQKIAVIQVQIEEWVDLDRLKEHVEFIDGIKVISSRTKYVSKKTKNRN